MTPSYNTLILLKDTLEQSITNPNALAFNEPEKYANIRMNRITKISADCLENVKETLPLLDPQFSQLVTYTLQAISENITSEGAVSYYKPKEYAGRRLDIINANSEHSLSLINIAIEPLSIQPVKQSSLKYK